MNDVDPQPTPLYRIAPGAEASDVHGRSVAAHFGDLAAEVAALREGVALVDAGTSEWLAVRGEDARDFLHRMLSQEIAAMPAGAVDYACLLDRKGGLIAPMRVWHEREPAAQFVLELPGGTCAAVTEALDAFIIADDVELGDERTTHTALALLGPRRDAVLGELGWQVPPTGGVVHNDSTVSLADAPLGEVPGVVVRVPVATLEALTPKLLDAVQAAGGRQAGFYAYDTVRVEQGQPLWKAELGSGMLAKEAGLEAGVSYTKGCYPGQEPTYRLHFRGKPSKRLMRLRLAEGSEPPSPLPKTPLTLFSAEGKEAGRVTSIARMPDGETVALGYVRRAYVEEKPALYLGEPQATTQLVPHDVAGLRPMREPTS